MSSRLLNLKKRCVFIFALLLPSVLVYSIESGGFAKVSISENRVWATTMPELVSYLTQDEGCTIYIKGTFNFTEKCHVASNKTLVGLAAGAKITGQGFVLDSVSNIALDNLDLSGIETEVIKMGAGTKHIWVNHCSFEGNDSLCLNICPGADSITISGCKFEDCRKVCTVGHGDVSSFQGDMGLRVTFFDNSMVGSKELCLDIRHSPICHLVYDQIESEDSVINVLAVEGAKVRVENSMDLSDSSAVVTEYEGLENGHATIIFEYQSDVHIIDSLVPEPTYSYNLLLLNDFYWMDWMLFWDYCGASDIAAQYNVASDYDGVGIHNASFSSVALVAKHSGRALTFVSDPDNDSVYKIIQGSENYSETNYIFDIPKFMGSDTDWDIITKEFYSDDYPFYTAYVSIQEDDAVAFEEGDEEIRFRLQRVEGSLCRVISYKNEKCLEVENASVDSGAAIILGTCRSGKTNQMFEMTSISSKLKSTTLIAPISETDISVYPNPAQSTLNIAVPSAVSDNTYTMEIINAIGQAVFSRSTLEGELNTVDISSLPTGVYWIKLVQGKHTLSKKFIKN